MSDTDKDIEILTLRHQLAILQQQTGKPYDMHGRKFRHPQGQVLA